MQGFCVKNCADYSGIQIWMTPLSDGAYALLIANFIVNNLSNFNICWKEIYLGNRTHSVRDLWEHKDLGEFPECCCSFNIAPHDSVFLKVKKS